MAVYIAPSDLGPGKNDVDVERLVVALRARGFDVYAAPGRDHHGRPQEQRFSVVVDLVDAYREIVKTEMGESGIIGVGPKFEEARADPPTGAGFFHLV